MEASENVTFEQAMERLGEIVRRLEEGDLALEDAMKLFEEGVKLAADCAKKLNEAQGRLEALAAKQDGSLERESLEL